MPRSWASKPKLPQQEGENDEACAIQKQLEKMGILDAAEGKELYRFLESRVIEHTNSEGRVLAVKVGDVVNRSESDMTHYAATHGVQAPCVHGCYDIINTRRKPIAKAMVSDRIPGVPLEDVWKCLSTAGRAAVTQQLRD